MEVVAWDQSAHLLFVQLFFPPRVPRSGREKKEALKALSKFLNSRCDVRSKNEQIGKWICVCALKLKPRHATWWQKLAACMNDDIRPPKTPLSRSYHMCSIQSVWHKHTCFFFFFIPSVSICQTGPQWPPFYMKANKNPSCSNPQCSYMKYKAPGHAHLLRNWKHTKYIKATIAPYLGFLFRSRGCPEQNKN